MNLQYGACGLCDVAHRLAKLLERETDKQQNRECDIAEVLHRLHEMAGYDESSTAQLAINLLWEIASVTK